MKNKDIYGKMWKVVKNKDVRIGGMNMGEIIRFSNYYEKSIYSEITNELKDTKTKKYKFSTITEYANRILV